MARPVADPYVYPGTTTLKNRLGIVDPTMLRLAEYAATVRRAHAPPTFPLTPEGYRATHRHLFQDVFPWAGEVRTVGLRNPRHDMEFAFPHAISGALATRFRQLEGQRNLAGLTSPEFAAGAAHHISELNAIHPFREGNGRTMRLHLVQVAEQAGHRLDVAALQGPAWNEASRTSFHTADSQSLAGIIQKGLSSPPPPQPERVSAALSPDGRLLYAALSEKIDRQMTKLTPEGKTEMRQLVARELLQKEEREGPVVLSDELRRIATAPAPVRTSGKPDHSPADPIKPSGRRR